MELKITYGNGKNLKLEATFTTEEERRDAVKMIKKTLVDLGDKDVQKSMEIYQKAAEQNYKENEEEKTIEYASEGQKRYMDKLGIQYNEKTTKIEAIDLINQWKIAHDVPITGKGTK